MKFLLAHWKTIGVSVLVASGIAYGMALNARISKLNASLATARQALQTAAAERKGYQPVTPTTPAKVEAALSREAKAELAAIRKEVKETSVTLHGLSTVIGTRETQGRAIPETPTSPPYCEDAFNMVRVNTKDCTFTFNLEGKIETNVLRGIDGKTRLAKQTFLLLDPVTHLPLPPESQPKVSSDFQITEEAAPEKVFGLKVLGGLDERLAPGLGLQALEKWRVSLRAMGFYSPKTEDLRGLLGLGVRPKIPWFDSAVSVGAGVGLSTKRSGLIYGAHLTVPLGSITK